MAELEKSEAYSRLHNAAAALAAMAEETGRALVGNVTLTPAGPHVTVRALNRDGQVMRESQRVIAWAALEQSVVDPLELALQDMRHGISGMAH